MSKSRLAAASQDEHPLLMNRHLDYITAVVLIIATATLLTLVWLTETLALIQRIDEMFLRTMLGVRADSLTAPAKVFDVLGSVWVTLPVRIAVSGYLAIKRRWWHFTAFVAAAVTAEIAIGVLKAVYHRPRPPASLVAISGGSFPSGHAVAASTIAVAIVIALFPPAGFRRWLWGGAAALFAFVMALSRAYLAAHWLSDAVGGTLLGTTVALGTALLVETLRSRQTSKIDPRPG